MSKKKNTDVKYMVQTGDVFNETDEDSTWIVGDTFFDKEPPIAMCRHINLDGGDDEEDRFDLRYVDRCVRLRQSFVEEGFADMDVYAIYKLTKKQLRRGLFLAKQNTDGLNTHHRGVTQKNTFFLNIGEVPSDVSGDDGDDEESDDPEMPELIDESKKDGQRQLASAAAMASTWEPATIGENTCECDSDGDDSDDSDYSDGEKTDVSALPGAGKNPGGVSQELALMGGKD